MIKINQDSIKTIEYINKEYFNLLDSYFKGIYNEQFNKFAHADFISDLNRAAKVIYLSLNDLEKDIEEFWKTHSPDLTIAIRNLNTFNVNFCGNISPLEGVNFIKRSALYTDSVLIEDPLFILSKIREFHKKERFLNNTILHIFNIYDMRELFFGNGKMPILLIIPPLTGEEILIKLRKEVGYVGIKYFNELFQFNFKDKEELLFDIKQIEKIPDLLSKVKNPDLLFINNPDHYLLGIQKSFANTNLGAMNIGEYFFLNIMGKLTNLSKEIWQSKFYNSQLVFDKKNLWDLHNWSYGAQMDGTIINSLHMEELKWLGEIDLGMLKEARNEDQLNHMRSILRASIFEPTNGINAIKTSSQVIKNIENAVFEHTAMINNLDKSLKRKYAIDTALVLGGLGVSIATFAINPASVIGLSSSIYGFIDYVKTTRQMEKDVEAADTCILGLLINAKGSG